MKRFLIAVALASLAGGVLQASAVIDCSSNSGNSCMASHIAQFTTKLDWAVFGTPDGALNTGVWTTSNAGGTGIGVTISPENLAPANEGMRLADNFASVFTGTTWTLASNIPTSPYGFAGRFDSAPNPGADSPGDHLIGLGLDGTGADGKLVMSFSSGLQSVGFRISSASDGVEATGRPTTFDTRIQIFSGAGGTGTLLGDATFTGLSAGGGCSGLYSTMQPTAPHTPVPCNDAPFYGFTNYTNIGSVVISTSDVSGFYLGALQFAPDSGGGIPEPTSLVLCGFGFGVILVGRARLRRRS